jgi:hypothetical protein
MKLRAVICGKAASAAAMVLGVLASGHIAQAQFEPRISGKPGEEHITSGFGVSVQGGGGVTNFTRSSERSITDVGGSWDVRAVLGTRTIPAFEAAYVGSARGVTSGVADGLGLVGNGLEGNFRLNAPLLMSDGVLVEPFAFIGLGWSHYTLNHVGSAAVITTQNDVGTVPMGAGLAVAYRGFLAEARFTYRPAYNDRDIVLDTGAGRGFDMDSWNVGLMVGFEF